MKKKVTKKKLTIPRSFIYPEILPEHRKYTYGTTNAGDIIRESGDWRDTLAPEEHQRKRNVESSACYIYAQLGAIADTQKEEFGMGDQDFAERFNALLSGGTSLGGDPLKGADSIRRDGVISESMMPFSEAITSWELFHSWFGANVRACIAAGKLFLKRWKLNNYIVFEREDSIEYKYSQLREALKRGTVPISVNGREWSPNAEGIYTKSKGSRDTHMVRCVYLDEKNQPHVRDTYPPFNKILEPYYNSDFAMRWTVQKKPHDKSFWDILKEFFNSFNKKEIIIDIKPELVEKVVHIPTNKEALLEVAKKALGTEVTPEDRIPDEVACSETLCTLLKKVFPDFPILGSTKDLDWRLWSDKRFERIADPEEGCIIVSPRTSITTGHTGIFLTSNRIASNDSKTGLFQDNYSYDSWITYFRQKKGLRIYLYKLNENDIAGCRNEP